jgi:hypothetical protein
VAWCRRKDVDEGEALDRSFPVGDKRSRVWFCGVVFWERKAVRRFVRSIVCAIASQD